MSEIKENFSGYITLYGYDNNHEIAISHKGKFEKKNFGNTYKFYFFKPNILNSSGNTPLFNKELVKDWKKYYSIVFLELL